MLVHLLFLTIWSFLLFLKIWVVKVTQASVTLLVLSSYIMLRTQLQQVTHGCYCCLTVLCIFPELADSFHTEVVSQNSKDTAIIDLWPLLCMYWTIYSHKNVHNPIKGHLNYCFCIAIFNKRLKCNAGPVQDRQTSDNPTERLLKEVLGLQWSRRGVSCIQTDSPAAQVSNKLLVPILFTFHTILFTGRRWPQWVHTIKQCPSFSCRGEAGSRIVEISEGSYKGSTVWKKKPTVGTETTADDGKTWMNLTSTCWILMNAYLKCELCAPLDYRHSNRGCSLSWRSVHLFYFFFIGAFSCKYPREFRVIAQNRL